MAYCEVKNKNISKNLSGFNLENKKMLLNQGFDINILEKTSEIVYHCSQDGFNLENKNKR